jgi:hypothetical protein
MSQGFVALVALVLLLFGGALWFGVARQRPWVVRFVFAITIFPALSQIAQQIYLLMRHAPQQRCLLILKVRVRSRPCGLTLRQRGRLRPFREIFQDR